jgi:2-keto-4-pentenoate hydratase/2-oxohepta-3-ene-1,7-dioic acid hydratase in catechol pathway
MKLVTFSAEGAAPRPGALDDDAVADLSSVAASVNEIVTLWAQDQGTANRGPAILERLRDALPGAPRRRREEVRLHPPLRPGKILCSGINYRGHAAENPRAVMPTEPFFFAKLPSSVCGDGDPVARHPRVTQMDYEVEFAAVIGRPLHQAREEEVMPTVFGYTLLNDLSARDVQFRDNQITLGKNFAGYAPIGPCLVTADDLPDPTAVRLTTHVNGRRLQDGSTADWLFTLPRLIAFLSGVMPLEPGDIVTTGTPAGVGVFRNPQVFLQPGDVVEIAAEGIGTLRTPIVAG